MRRDDEEQLPGPPSPASAVSVGSSHCQTQGGNSKVQKKVSFLCAEEKKIFFLCSFSNLELKRSFLVSIVCSDKKISGYTKRRVEERRERRAKFPGTIINGFHSYLLRISQ